MNRFNSLDITALILMIIGAINWGLVGILGLDLVSTIFGATTLISRLIYILVGLGGLYGLTLIPKISSRADNT